LRALTCLCLPRVDEYLELYLSHWNLIPDEGARRMLAQQTVRDLYRYRYGFDHYTLEACMLGLSEGACADVSLDRAREDWARLVAVPGLEPFVPSEETTSLVTDVERAGSQEHGLRIYKEARVRHSFFRGIVYGVEQVLFLAFALHLDWAHKLGTEAFCALARELVAPEILGGEHLYRMLHTALPGSTLLLKCGTYHLREEIEVTTRINLLGTGGTQILLDRRLWFLAGTTIRNVMFRNPYDRATELLLQGVGWHDHFRLENVSCFGVALRAQYCSTVHLLQVHVCDALVGLRVFHVRRLILDGSDVFKSHIARCQRALYIAETDSVRLCDTVVVDCGSVLDVHVLRAFEAWNCQFSYCIRLGEINMFEGKQPTLVGNRIRVLHDQLLLGPVDGDKRVLTGMNTAPPDPAFDRLMLAKLAGKRFDLGDDPAPLLPRRASTLQERLVQALNTTREPRGLADVHEPPGWKPVPTTSSRQHTQDIDYYFRAMDEGPAARVRPSAWYIGQLVAEARRMTTPQDKMLFHVETPIYAIETSLLDYEKESLDDRVRAWLTKAVPRQASDDATDKQLLAWALDKEYEILCSECVKTARDACNGQHGGHQ
jgi:hypothetical protein